MAKLRAKKNGFNNAGSANQPIHNPAATTAHNGMAVHIHLHEKVTNKYSSSSTKKRTAKKTNNYKKKRK